MSRRQQVQTKTSQQTTIVGLSKDIRRQEQESQMRAWSEKLTSDLSHPGSTVQTKTDTLTDQLTTVKQRLTANKMTYDQRKKLTD